LFSSLRTPTDVDDVKFVINYDFPSNIEDYVHRIGRTGRSNNKGTSYTFFTQTNGGKVDELVNILNETNQVRRPKVVKVPLVANRYPSRQYVNPELYALKRFGGNNRRGGGGRGYGQQHGTFKKGSFGGQKSYGGGNRYENGGGYKSYQNGSSSGGSRFSDRNPGEGGSRQFANGHTRFN
jgi:ATP-dependent RNA helicase DDX5/DBP2